FIEREPLNHFPNRFMVAGYPILTAHFFFLPVRFLLTLRNNHVGFEVDGVTLFSVLIYKDFDSRTSLTEFLVFAHYPFLLFVGMRKAALYRTAVLSCYSVLSLRPGLFHPGHEFPDFP